MQLLLDSGGSIDLETAAGLTPLDAARGSNHQFVGVLLERGANINLKTATGLTPPDITRNRNYLSVVELLM